jgi:putative SOS response-associated peptidase YedK
MCGRFTLTIAERQMVAEMLGVDPDSIPEDYRPRYNIAPTDPHFIVTSKYEQRRATGARWGLVNSSARDNSRAAACINAKAETIDTRGAFRDAFIKRRCVIPAGGFYEWTGPKNARRPIRFHRKAGGLLLFAGLYESWFPEKNQPQMTFTIITCAPNGLLAPIHNRMPVVLNERGADDWMNPLERDPSSLKRLLVPAPDDALMASPASPLVNRVKNDGPELLVAPTALL